MKFLCICDGGNVRSQAMAYVLHDLMAQEAIAVGRLRISEESMENFCSWADKIIIMQPKMEESVPKRYKEKLLCVDVGNDRFGIYVHPELLVMVKQGADWILGKEKFLSETFKNHA
jgi:predicted protein tyrosine phosphatase